MSLKRLILICGLLLIATATGCSTGSKVEENASPAPTATSASETKPVEEKTVATPKEKTELYLVTGVIDGDTIKVEINGRIYNVRYIGINTPEMDLVECFGQAATDKNRELVKGQKVRLEKDVSETDKHGRLLRYVWVGGTFVNQQLVLEGYAHSVTYPPDVKYQEKFIEAEKNARNNNRGLWSDCQGGQGTVAPADNQDQCLIKGNISSSGKIYHLPSCPNYAETIINEDKGERWFCTEEEAITAGWRKAKNCP